MTKYSPEYIKCYLSSDSGQEEIMKYATGSTTSIISVANLWNIEIPVYDEGTQKEHNKHTTKIVAAVKDSISRFRFVKMK